MATKIYFDFDPEEATGIKLPPSKRAEALQDVADYLREATLSDIGEGRSPVDGEGKFPVTPPVRHGMDCGDSRDQEGQADGRGLPNPPRLEELPDLGMQPHEAMLEPGIPGWKALSIG